MTDHWLDDPSPYLDRDAPRCRTHRAPDRRRGGVVIIEIKDDGNGAWNLTAKTKADDWPPLYMAYGRSVWAIGALVRGILTDFDETEAEPRTAAEETS